MITDKALLMALYRKMVYVRKFEEALARFFSRGMLHGTGHLCIGEEAAAVGSAAALSPGDPIFSTHRGHGHAVAFGLDMKRMMAEIFGKATGYCKGKGGSMHIADPASGHLGANGIVGAGLPLATGAALAIKLRKQRDRAALCFFGDGASNQGAFHESLNMAQVWKLPVLYVCVNNQYGMSMHITRSMGETDIEKRAVAYGMHGLTVDGNDVAAVYEAVKEARDYALKHGPVLIVENTYRIAGHSKSDVNRYRTQEEIDAWKEKCPIKKLGAYLIANGIACEAELDAVAAQAEALIQDAADYALSSPEPDDSDLIHDVYA